jgi:nucleoside-diphosphate-sugar epimerase
MLFGQIRGKLVMFTQIAMRELESNPNISHANANKELGYESHPLKQMIDDTVDWFWSYGLFC